MPKQLPDIQRVELTSVATLVAHVTPGPDIEFALLLRTRPDDTAEPKKIDLKIEQAALLFQMLQVKRPVVVSHPEACPHCGGRL